MPEVILWNCAERAFDLSLPVIIIHCKLFAALHWDCLQHKMFKLQIQPHGCQPWGCQPVELTVKQFTVPIKCIHHWCTVGCTYITESVWICLNQTGTSGHCHFSPLFLAKQFKLCQVACGSFVNNSFQVHPQILDWIEIWTLTWPLQNLHFVVFKSFLRCFCCNKSSLKL